MTRLELSGIEVVRGGRPLLTGVNLSVDDGELVALVGPNGSGKSTLLRVVLGLVRPTCGRVRLAGRELEELTPRERAGEVAWLPQHTEERAPVPVLESVATARYRFAESREAALTAARVALERLGVGPLAERRLDQLSGGERQRVELAATIAQDARVVLLDEPANHLDPAQQREVFRLIGALATPERAFVCVTHELNLLYCLGAPERVRVVGLDRGTIAIDRRLDDPELGSALGRLFGLPLVAVEVEGQRFLLPVGGAP